MEVMVEFGKTVTSGAPCPISGQFRCPNPTQGAQLAKQIAHVLLDCPDHSGVANLLHVNKHAPRLWLWNSTRTAWVSVSILDGVMRGPACGLVKSGVN